MHLLIDMRGDMRTVMFGKTQRRRARALHNTFLYKDLRSFLHRCRRIKSVMLGRAYVHANISFHTYPCQCACVCTLKRM